MKDEKDAITEIAEGFGLASHEVAELRKLMMMGRFNESDPAIITAIMMARTHAVFAHGLSAVDRRIKALDERLSSIESEIKNA
ncbi:MAG: hypothetical protein CTY25_12080 [Methylobacterium sp.]|nr:MAG: hypothetical protein CTY25_12080 [Methylobacterium sp.]